MAMYKSDQEERKLNEKMMKDAYEAYARSLKRVSLSDAVREAWQRRKKKTLPMASGLARAAFSSIRRVV